MYSFPRKMTIVFLTLLLANLCTLTAAAEDQPEAPESSPELGSIEAQEAAADAFDAYERIIKRFFRGHKSHGIQDQIDRARGQIFMASPEELKVMGETMGGALIELRHSARKLSTMLLSETPEEPLSSALASGAKPGSTRGDGHPPFPMLRSDTPAYPEVSSINSAFNLTEADLEDTEDEFEENEIEIEDTGGATNVEVDGFCDVVLDNGRADRATPEALIAGHFLVNEASLLDGIYHDICGGTSVVSCSICCIPFTILRGVAEFIWDNALLCEDLIDSAEIEATFHNTKVIFAGLEHIHNDLRGLDTESLNDQMVALGVQLFNAEVDLTSRLDAVENNLDGELDTLGTQLTHTKNVLTSRLNTVGSSLNDQITDAEAALSSQVIELETLEIQLKIEQQLATNGKIVQFQLPESVGGFLETVRDIVDDAIVRTYQSGQDPGGDARRFWIEGNQALALGHFKSAYESYAIAYQHLLN